MPDNLIKKIRTSSGDLQIDYNALANLPDLSEYETAIDATKKLDEAKTYTDEKIAANKSSGVYVGSGDMPEGYNVQIDPNGDTAKVPTKVSELINDMGYITSGSNTPTRIDLSSFDANGTIVETYADGSTKTNTVEFDADGNPVKITDGDGNETVLTW